MANPNISVFSAAGDGLVRQYSGSSWATIRVAATGSDADPTGTGNYGCYAEHTTPQLGRGFFPFDTSSVPDGAVVTAATLYLWVTAASGAGGGSFMVVESTQASTSTLTTSDYSAVGSTELSSRVNFSGLATGAYLAMPLNAAGVALVSKTGYTKLALRSSFDLDAPAPGALSNMQVKFSEQSGTSNDPYLVVEYSTVQTTSDSWAWSDSVDRVRTVQRATSDTWAWGADAAEVTGRSGNTTLGWERTSVGDSWAWSDAAANSYVIEQDNEIVLFPRGPQPTSLTSSINFASLSTLPLAVMPSDAPTSGQVTVYSVSGQRAWTVSYTGKSGLNLTGCTSWKTSGTAASGTTVAWQNAEKNFPSIVNLPATTTYPYGRLYATCTAHCSDLPTGAADGTMIARYSDDGGQTWSTETVIATAVDSAYGIYGVCSASYADGTLWVGWYEHNIDYFNVKSYSKYSTDGGITWSSPVEIPATVVEADSTFIAVGAGPFVDELDDLYLPVYMYPDGADQSVLPYIGYSAIVKSTDYGATWTLRGTIPMSATASRGTTEPAIEDIGNGTWIVMLRHEVGTDPGDTLDRYRIFTDDKGATYRDGATAVSSLSNMCNVVQHFGGALVTQGYHETSPFGPRNYYSYDNGLTWPTSAAEATDGYLEYYVGADQVRVTLTDGVSGIASVRGLQGTTAQPLSTAQTYFRWLTFPPYTADTWAWSDTATRTQAFSRTSISDFFTYAPDTWAWSDTASGALSSYLSRTTSDTWAWSDTAVRSADPASRTTSDTWAWSDTAADTYAGPHYYSRTTSDTWAWSDSTGALGTALYWLRAARRRSMSAPTKTYTVVQAKGTTRTATWTSPTYESKTEAGILVALDVTAASGTGGLTLRINAHDLAGSTVVPLNTAPTAVTAIGTTSYALYPFGAISGAVTQSTSGYLPRMFSISVTAGDSSSYTYSLGYCLLP